MSYYRYKDRLESDNTYKPHRYLIRMNSQDNNLKTALLLLARGLLSINSFVNIGTLNLSLI